MILSCKSDEINPIDKLMGYYFAAILPKDYVDRINSSSIRTIRLEKKTGDIVILTANNVLYKRSISSGGGYEDFYKDFVFSNCKIILLDTLGLGNKNPPFAKIINTTNNTEMGNIRSWVSYPDGIKTNYYRFETDFFVTDSLKYPSYVYKWAD